MAGAAGEVGIDDDVVAGAEAAAGGRLLDRGGEFVADDPRVGEEGVGALEDMVVGAADAGAADADQHLAFGAGGPDRARADLVRREADDGFHLVGPPERWGREPDLRSRR